MVDGGAPAVSVGGFYYVGTVYAALTTRLDPLGAVRLLVPCYPFLAVAAVSVVWKAVAAAARHRMPAHRSAEWHERLRSRYHTILMAGPSALLVVGAIAATLRYGYALQLRERIGPTVTTSPVLNAAAEFHSVPLVSNNAPNAAWVTGRPVLASPTYRGTPVPDPTPADVDGLSNLATAGTLLIWANGGDNDEHQLSLEAIASFCRLELLDTHEDGTVYRVPDCNRGL